MTGGFKGYNGLRERIATLEKEVKASRELEDERFRNAKESISLAAKNLHYRLEQMNDFRRQIQNERGEYVTRTQLDLILQRIEENIKLLTERRDFAKGRDWAFGVIVVIMASGISALITYL